MIKFILPAMLIFVFIACKKEKDELPHLTFTKEEKEWMIYEAGQEFKFRNDNGDSLVYMVTEVRHDTHTPEYIDTTWVPVAYNESYYAKLTNANDSIIIYFYKASSMYDPHKLRQTIRWHGIKNQFVKLAAIENNAPFTSRMINGKTYSFVTPAIPLTDDVAPWTLYDKAYYDQKAGFIEIIDLNGVSWKRV
jgi:hypothetical protein